MSNEHGGLCEVLRESGRPELWEVADKLESYSQCLNVKTKLDFHADHFFYMQLTNTKEELN